MGNPETMHLHHFSHAHTLSLTNQSHPKTPDKDDAPLCAICNHNVSGLYTCTTCNFHLHYYCARIPQRIRHLADPDHIFTLHANPVYPNGKFQCNACGGHGRGLCFHCKNCELDLHVVCSMRPVSLHSEAHHHPLKLNFTSPYKEKGFTCDVCGQLGLDHWLYRCDACGFDTHLSCAFKPQRHKHHYPQPPPPCHGVMNPQQIPQVNTIFRSPTITGHPYLLPGIASAGHLMNGPSLGVPQVAGPDALNNLMVHAGRGFVDGFAQQMGQSVVQAMLGGSAPFSGLNLASSILGLSSSEFGLGSALLGFFN